jgi:hypothetical protein
MGAANGSLGGIAIKPEVVYGTPNAGGTWVWQHPMPSTLGLRRELIQPNLLSLAGHTARGYSGKYVDGEMTVGLELNKDVIGDILGLAGSYDSLVYTLAGGDAPDVNSLSVLMSYGGGGAATYTNNLEWINKGIKANSLRFDLVPDSNSSLTLVGIGQDSANSALGTALEPSPPLETAVFMPSDLGTLTILSKVLCLYSATFEALVPKTGFDKKCMGGLMREPETADRPDVTFTFNLDLSNGADNDTLTILNAFTEGTVLNDITIGSDFTLTDCIASGDFPPLQQGQIDFVLSGTAASIEVTVTDPA